jgi:hypothetical protein
MIHKRSRVLALMAATSRAAPPPVRTRLVHKQGTVQTENSDAFHDSRRHAYILGPALVQDARGVSGSQTWER